MTAENGLPVFFSGATHLLTVSERAENDVFGSNKSDSTSL